MYLVVLFILSTKVKSVSSGEAIQQVSALDMLKNKRQVAGTQT